MGVSIVMGLPQSGGFLLGKIPAKWMITGGTPVSGNLHISFTKQQQTALKPSIRGDFISAKMMDTKSQKLQFRREDAV